MAENGFKPIYKNGKCVGGIIREVDFSENISLQGEPIMEPKNELPKFEFPKIEWKKIAKKSLPYAIAGVVGFVAGLKVAQVIFNKTFGCDE